jgi:CheY-like chemotaxis protein
MKHKRILLVDDDPDDQLIFEEALSEITSTIECIIADNGKDALEKMNTVTSVPSIFFVDLNMPSMDGFELLSHIKNEKKFNTIPVVILTTSNNPADEKRCFDLGAAIFLTKTSNFRSFMEILRKILETDFQKVGEGDF